MRWAARVRGISPTVRGHGLNTRGREAKRSHRQVGIVFGKQFHVSGLPRSFDVLESGPKRQAQTSGSRCNRGSSARPCQRANAQTPRHSTPEELKEFEAVSVQVSRGRMPTGGSRRLRWTGNDIDRGELCRRARSLSCRVGSVARTRPGEKGNQRGPVPTIPIYPGGTGIVPANASPPGVLGAPRRGSPGMISVPFRLAR
jgi:hypothetical protein